MKGVGVALKAKEENVVLVLSCAVEEVMISLTFAETTTAEGVGVELALFVMRAMLVPAVAISEVDIAIITVEGELLLVTEGVGIRVVVLSNMDVTSIAVLVEVVFVVEGEGVKLNIVNVMLLTVAVAVEIVNDEELITVLPKVDGCRLV